MPFGLDPVVLEQKLYNYFSEMDLEAIERAIERLDRWRVFKFDYVEEKIEETLKKIEDLALDSNACEADQQEKVGSD